MNQNDLTESVIPGLTRNPEVHHWIPAFAGMTYWDLASVFYRFNALQRMNSATGSGLP